MVSGQIHGQTYTRTWLEELWYWITIKRLYCDRPVAAILGAYDIFKIVYREFLSILKVMQTVYFFFVSASLHRGLSSSQFFPVLQFSLFLLHCCHFCLLVNKLANTKNNNHRKPVNAVIQCLDILMRSAWCTP